MRRKKCYFSVLQKNDSENHSKIRSSKRKDDDESRAKSSMCLLTIFKARGASRKISSQFFVLYRSHIALKCAGGERKNLMSKKRKFLIF
jgi:hypothetical protein